MNLLCQCQSVSEITTEHTLNAGRSPCAVKTVSSRGYIMASMHKDVEHQDPFIGSERNQTLRWRSRLICLSATAQGTQLMLVSKGLLPTCSMSAGSVMFSSGTCCLAPTQHECGGSRRMRSPPHRPTVVPFPLSYEQDQSYANPVNSTSPIRYRLPHAPYVTLSIFNMRGQKKAQPTN